MEKLATDNQDLCKSIKSFEEDLFNTWQN